MSDYETELREILLAAREKTEEILHALPHGQMTAIYRLAETLAFVQAMGMNPTVQIGTDVGVFALCVLPSDGILMAVPSEMDATIARLRLISGKQLGESAPDA
jgi:hypothetical protein